MTKIIKRVLVAFVLAICVFALAACQMGGSNNGGGNGGEGGGGSQSGATVAKLPANLQGTYYGDDVVVVVSESKVSITDPSGKVQEFVIYEENGRYYVEEEGNKNYCTFGDGTVSNSHGTFSKDPNGGSGDGSGSGTGTDDKARNEAQEKIRRISGIANFKLPEGGTVRVENINSDGLVGCGVIVVGSTETFASYKAYFDKIVKENGYEETFEGFTKDNGDSFLGMSLAQGENGEIQVAAFEASGVQTDEIAVATFQAQFKEATGIDIVFPDYVTSVVVPIFEIKNKVTTNINFEAEGVSDASEESILAIANIIGPNFEAAGLVKGEVSSSTYEGVVTFTLEYHSADYQSQLSISVSSYSGYTMCTVFYTGPIPQGEPEWPAEAIAKIFGTHATVPAFEGEFSGVTALEIQGQLSVLVSGVDQKDATLWLEKLVRAGFTAQDEDLYVNRYGEYDAAVVEASFESGMLAIKFYLQEMTSNPWPSSEITAKFNAAVEQVLPKLDGTNRSFMAQEYNVSLYIYVTGAVNDQTAAEYNAQLLKAGFIFDSYEYVYTFENYDTLKVYASMGSTGGVDALMIHIQYEEYEPIQYIIPENFEAEILGFKLVKIGESYIYSYAYSGSSTSVTEYLYDATSKTWTKGSAIVYPFAVNGKTIVWQSFDQNDPNAITQIVNKPQIDDFLRGTSGLAYSYYEQYLEAMANDPASVVRDGSKDATIAGFACEYYKITDDSLASYGMTSVIELWINPTSHMIFKVVSNANYNGQETSNIAFEIKSFNTNVTSFADAGFSNCILVTKNGSNLTDNDHTWGEVIESGATCGTAGEKYQVCSCCNEKKVLGTVPATGQHTPQMDGNNPAWYTDYQGHHNHYCTTCRQYYGEEDCDYDEWIIDSPATCKHEGLRHHSCKVCGATERGTMPIDPNAHLFLRENFNDATVVFPTKETAGSITWECIEDCGATYTIELPILNADNYARIIYKDYDDNWEEQNYELYVIILSDLVAELKAKLNPSFTVDEYYVLQYVFNYQLANNRDYDNLLYGFKGDQVADEVASVPKSIQGEYYNEENLKVNVGESAVTIYGEQTQIFTLYSKDEDIYFNYDGSKVYVTVNDDGSIEAGDFGLFTRRIVASIGKALQGIYVSEEEGNNTYIEVYEDHVKVITGGGNDLEYTLYEDGDYYFIIMNDEKVSVYPSEENVYVDNIGFFVRPNQGGEGGEEGGDELEDTELWPVASIANFLGFEDFYIFGYEGAEYTWNSNEEYGIIYVQLTLPEDVDAAEVVASFIDQVEEYDQEADYAILDGYYLSIQEYEGSVMVQYGLPQ